MHATRHLLKCPIKLAAEREAAISASITPQAVPVATLANDVVEDVVASPEIATSQVDAVTDVQPVSESQQTSIDLSFEMCKLFTLCNQGRGLPDKDIQSFIDTWNVGKASDPSGYQELDYKTLGEFKKYRQGFVLDSEPGAMKTVVIDITEEDVPGLSSPLQFPFAMKDMRAWLEEEFERAEYKEEVEGSHPVTYKSGLCMEAAPVYRAKEDGSRQRVITTPDTADVWIKLQAKLRQQPMRNDAFIAAVQLYSDKTLVNHKGMTCHPVKASLFNVPYAKRIKGILSDVSTVAYFQDLNIPDYITASDKRLVKLSYMSKALELLLAPLKEASFEGMRVMDPVGSMMEVYPRLLSYVMDLPESKDVFMVKGLPGAHPCEACMVHKDELKDIFKADVDARTVEQQKQFYDELMSEKNKAARLKLSTSLSTQPVPCPLFGFDDQEEDDECSVLQVLSHESLHNDDLGVFLYLINYLDKYFAESESGGGTIRARNLVYKKMNQRLESMPRAG